MASAKLAREAVPSRLAAATSTTAAQTTPAGETMPARCPSSPSAFRRSRRHDTNHSNGAALSMTRTPPRAIRAPDSSKKLATSLAGAS